VRGVEQPDFQEPPGATDRRKALLLLDYQVALCEECPYLRMPPLAAQVAERDVLATLRTALEELPNVAFVDEAPVVDLVVEAGVVTGLVVDQHGRRQQVRSRTVVLATDGFAASCALMDRFCRDLGAPFYGGVSTSTGDAVDWLERVGATFRNMGACLCSGPGGGRPRHPGLSRAAVQRRRPGQHRRRAARRRGGTRVLVDGRDPPRAAG
jgi:hypothetical protein